MLFCKKGPSWPENSTSFGVKAGPPTLLCRDDVLVENAAAVPKSCFSPLEMRTPKTAGGLLSRHQNVYSDNDHPSPAASLVLSDRRDRFEDFNSQRLVLQQFLVDKQPASSLLAEDN